MTSITLKIIGEMLNDIYNIGNMPNELLTSTFTTLPKKPGTKECEDFTTISLSCHHTNCYSEPL